MEGDTWVMGYVDTCLVGAAGYLVAHEDFKRARDLVASWVWGRLKKGEKRGEFS